MEKVKIIVRPESANLWWGIYGFCEKIGWEDLNLYFENEERIGFVCLNSKAYLRAGLDDLRNDPEGKDFLTAVEKYLADNKCHYWYYYYDKDSEHFNEVPYLAPKNDKGVKPRSMEIWHPDEGIGISTIESGIKSWAKEHLGLQDCEIKIENHESFEDSLKHFEEMEKRYGGESRIESVFTDELVDELSRLWKKPKDYVLEKLKNATK